MKLVIKNMVCPRCILVVKDVLQSLDIKASTISLGEVELEKSLQVGEKNELNTRLQAVGFEIIDNKQSIVIEKLKSLIINLAQHPTKDIKTNLSDYLASELGMDYSSLSKQFSEVENVTIEKYYINQKTEKVKELLVYNELTLSEIAIQLNYSSVNHLSSQFKKVTGYTPTAFKQLKAHNRLSIDTV